MLGDYQKDRRKENEAEKEHKRSNDLKFPKFGKQ